MFPLYDSAKDCLPSNHTHNKVGSHRRAKILFISSIATFKLLNQLEPTQVVFADSVD